MQLARLAVGVRLDGLDKLKEVMDKMVAELKQQQQQEHEKHDKCKDDLHANGKESRTRQSEANELTRQITIIEGAVSSLTEDLEELRTELSAAHLSLQKAGEERQAENHEFQQVVADQKGTQAVLSQALERLRKFYDDESLLALRARARGHQEPGQPSSKAPASGLEYSKSGGAAGVLSMLEKVLQDSKKAQQEAVAAEQSSEDAYSELVSNTNAMLDATNAAISEKTALKAKKTSDLLDANRELTATGEALADLADEAKAMHLDCDFLLKNFDVRQTARQQEVEAIQEAKAILAGADFGNEKA